ncbi:MAG: endolytic transglycosylase MltG [Candidatus Nomurabacteria bacterium]|nr:MAG: endolytic transglycosylase MltG [Candidatus Nomurabacteria bacterium]
MQPNGRRSIDGFQRQRPAQNPESKTTQKRQPEYRPDHELPAPKPTPTLPKYDTLSLPKPSKSHRIRRWILAGVAVLIAALVVIFIMAFAWYRQELTPVSTDTTKRVRVTIPVGASPTAIGQELKKDGIIRNEIAFSIYIKLSGTENKLKAGVYSLQPSLSTPATVDHLVSGKTDTFNVTFLPGDTLANNRKLLLGLGYSTQQVDSALSKTYDSPLFATKPANADLEGYFYGETIQFDYSASVDVILERFFSEFENYVSTNKLVPAFKKQGLTLYQGITLASIVQREVAIKDMPAVARVFLNRLKAGMTLGSDVTYQYAAKKLGVAPSPSLDSPYNTRKYAGLPPGPIATPGNSALLAVAHPANNDYLFFLSGDDGVTYFSKTEEGHQQNVTQHCQKKCLIP